MTRADDGRGLPLDEDAKRVAIPGENGVDRGAFIDDLDPIGWRNG